MYFYLLFLTSSFPPSIPPSLTPSFPFFFYSLYTIYISWTRFTYHYQALETNFNLIMEESRFQALQLVGIQMTGTIHYVLLRVSLISFHSKYKLRQFLLPPWDFSLLSENKYKMCWKIKLPRVTQNCVSKPHFLLNAVLYQVEVVFHVFIQKDVLSSSNKV